MPTLTFDQWLAIAGFIGTSIGIVLSVVFYRRSVQEPIPTYAAHPLRVRLVDKTRMKLSGLEVSHNGIPLGGANVTATTVYFWNNGRLPIRKSDVLEPFVIELDEHSEVLDCHLVKKTREACGFHLESLDSIKVTNYVRLEFSIIEHGDGVAIQIVHTGNPEGKIRMKGACVGAKELKKADFTALAADAPLTFIATLLLWLAVVVTMGSLRQVFEPKRSQTEYMLTLFGVGIVLGIVQVSIMRIRHRAVPKFLD
jgi:hypothetical protein